MSVQQEQIDKHHAHISKTKIPCQFITVKFADFEMNFDRSEERKLSDLFMIAWVEHEIDKGVPRSDIQRTGYPAQYRLQYFDVRKLMPELTDYMHWNDDSSNQT